VGITDHVGDGWPALAETIASIISHEKVEASLIVRWGNPLVIGYCFAVSVEIEDGGIIFILHPEPAINPDSLFDIDEIAGSIRRGKLAGQIKGGIDNRKENPQYLGAVKK